MKCHMQELLLPLAAHLSYLPRMNVRVEGLCTQKLLLPLINFDDIWNTYISGQDDMSHAKMVAHPLLHDWVISLE